MSFNFDPNNQGNPFNPYPEREMPRHYIVTQSARNIKAMARQTLSGNWLKAIIAAFIMELIMSGPGLLLSLVGDSSILSFINDIYSIVISGPANVGLMAFFMAVFRMQKPDNTLIYKGFESKEIFLKGLMVYCSMMIRIILLSFLFIIPGIIAAFKYSMAFRVLVDHPEYSSRDCLSASANMMSGNKMKYFLLSLSFWFWTILASIPRGICAKQALSNVVSLELLLSDVEVFTSYINQVFSNPWILLSYALTIVLNVYIQVSGCCFYDLAAGNLVVRQSDTGDDYNVNQ